MIRLARVNGIALSVLALSAGAAYAESTIVISVAGEAFEGPPAFDLMIDGKVVGSATLTMAIATETDGRLFTKPRPRAFLEEFTFQVPDDSLLPDKEISIALTNDKFAEREGEGEDGILDRNLFIDFIRVNGLEITSAELALTKAGEAQTLDYQAGLLPIYEAGYSVVAKPPAGGWPPPEAAASWRTEPGLVPTPMLASLARRMLDLDPR